MSIILMVAAVAFATVADVPPVKGSLCFAGSSECIATTGSTIEVKSDELDRLFVWTREDHRRIVAGELSKGATALSFEENEDTRTVAFSLRGEGARGWPADVAFTLARRDKNEWAWTVPADAAGGDTTIVLPRGPYRLEIVAPRHARVIRRVMAEKDIALGAIELEPLPAISGRVVTTDEDALRAVHGAQVVVFGEIVAMTGSDGRFRFELPEPYPETMLVVSAGLATQVLPLANLQGDRDLGDLKLESGHSLRLTVDRPGVLRDKTIRVRLLRENERIHEHTEITTTELRPEQEELEFRDLPPGDYFVIFRGEEPLERLMHPVEIADADVEETVAIKPYQLQGSVMFGEDRMANSELQISPERGGPTWRTRVKTDDAAEFTATAWQSGKLHAFVTPVGETGGLLFVTSPDLGTDPSEWKIAFRKRLIHGRIVAKEGGVPLQDVELRLHKTTSSSQGYTTLRPTSGEYEILAWENGTYDLTLKVPDYPMQEMTIELAEEDGSRRVDFELEKGSPITLEVVSASGARLANTSAIAGVSRDGHNPKEMFRTDAEGLLRLRLRNGESKTLYILPEAGSFAIVRVTGSERDEETLLRVEVPPPAGTLRLKLKNAEGKDAHGIVVLRFNGEWMPYPVTGRIRQKADLGMTDFLAVPAGTYEVWAVRPKGRAAVSPLPPAHPPVTVGLHGGDGTGEVVVVTP